MQSHTQEHLHYVRRHEIALTGHNEISNSIWRQRCIIREMANDMASSIELWMQAGS